MTLHFTVVCDRSGDIVHQVFSRLQKKKESKLSDLVVGDADEVIDRIRSAGAVFGIDMKLASDGSQCKLAGVYDRGHALVICADNSQEITKYYAVLKGIDPSGLLEGSFDQDVYDQITRLNNELINAQRDFAKINSRYSHDLERLGLTLANIGSGIIVLDGDGKVEFINEAAKRILKTEGDPVGRTCEEIYRAEDEDASDQPERNQSDSGRVMPTRKILRTFDEKTLHIIDSINPLGDFGKVIAFQDITPIEELQADLWRSNELLRLMTKVIRHDVLNHLTVVNGYIQMADPDSKSDKLNQAIAAADKAESIIRQMKEMENMVLSKGNLEEYRLSDVVKDVMEGHSIDWSIRGDSSVLADPAIFSVIENLVSNAIRHGGTDRVDFIVSDEGHQAELRVVDQGTGVPDSIKDMLFQEGFSFGRAANTGLGLYLAKMVLQRYGGDISVEDNEPHGAVFILSFKVPGE